MNKAYDIIVIGAGHAGVEAALSAARTGCKTALVTLSLDMIANMPCNPSVGGTGKGQLVFEIDALGGEMGYFADCATIQSRTLNESRGAAVRSKRVQADRRRYGELAKATLEKCENLFLIQGQATRLLIEKSSKGHRAVGVEVEPGGELYSSAVILCAGTYPDGTTHIGKIKSAQGPDGMKPSVPLSAMFGDTNVRFMRFKTGTPPRVNRRSIDFSALSLHCGEAYIIPFSMRTDETRLNSITQVPCHIVYTNAKTHEIIRNNLDKSPMFSGQIHGTGPRYCPSIEDKVVRFADKPRHQLFVEPTGLCTDEMYIQGFSSSMPDFVQYQMLRSLDGFAEAEIMRFAYAIEYDCIDPVQLAPTLEFKDIENLFSAGQTNGSSGYEEAACQGLVAGLNASLKIRKEQPLILPRSSSYIGTLIDDLVTKGTNEPYRIMTSRSEFRLLLREDNAAERLSKIGFEAGLLPKERYLDAVRLTEMKNAEIRRLETSNTAPSEALSAILEAAGSTDITTGVKTAELVRRPGVTYEMLAEIDKNRPDLPKRVADAVQTEIKYKGYVKRQLDEAQRFETLETHRLPPNIDYSAIKGLRIEAAQKLAQIRPASIGQAQRISGVSPADIAVLLVYLKMRRGG